LLTRQLPGGGKASQCSCQKRRLFVEAKAAASPSEQKVATSNENHLVDGVKSVEDFYC